MRNKYDVYYYNINKTLMNPKFVISSKNMILRKLDMDKNTRILLYDLVKLFINDCDKFKWEIDDIESFKSIITDLLSSEDGDNFIICISMIKNLKRNEK
jgi:hypothetical protein